MAVNWLCWILREKESQGLFSFAEISSYGGGTAHSNLPEDNLSS